MEEHDVVDNISSIKIYSKGLQGKIIEIGNKIKTQIGLFDLILKEKKVIADKIKEVNCGPNCDEEKCQIEEKIEKIEKIGENVENALNQEVDDVDHEIELVNHSVRRLENDENVIINRDIRSSAVQNNIRNVAEIKKSKILQKISDKKKKSHSKKENGKKKINGKGKKQKKLNQIEYVPDTHKKHMNTSVKAKTHSKKKIANEKGKK